MSEPSSATQIANQLPRKFGFWTGLFAVFASMVGTGITTSPGLIINATGSHSINLTLWVIGGLLALCGALTLAEVGSAYPLAGGDYIYIREAYGRSIAFVYGWAMIIVGFAAPIANVANQMANNLFVPIQSALAETSLKNFLGDPGLDPESMNAVISNSLFNQIFASILVAGFVLFHALGHRGSSTTQAIVTIFTVVVLGGMATLGLLFGKGSFQHIVAGTAEPVKLTPSLLGQNLIYVMYAYTGWNGAVYLAGELKEASRLLPRCLIGGCLAVMGLYLLINVTYAYAMSPETIAGLPKEGRERIATSAVRFLFDDRAMKVVGLLIGLCQAAAISVFILTGARVAYAMSRDGLTLPIIGRTHAKLETPLSAICFLGAIAILFLWSGTFEQVYNFAGYGLGILSLLVVTPIFLLRRTQSYQPTFRVPLFPLPTVLFIGVSIFMLISGAIESWQSAVYNILIFVGAYGLYCILHWQGLIATPRDDSPV